MSLIDALSDDRENRSKARSIHGVAIGIISNAKDPQGIGRVKLQFPWLSEDNESDWAKVASFMAGKDRGGFFLPEVGDEVLVAFEHGDINSPYVIGALWSGEDKPPETNMDGKNNIRKIRSRSGHEIIFDDNDSGQKEKLEIRTNSGHSIILDDATGQEKIEFMDKTGSNKISIDSTQNSIEIESAMQLKIKSNVVEIEGTTALSLKSNAVLTIEGLPVKIN